jgi:hypothetical protein
MWVLPALASNIETPDQSAEIATAKELLILAAKNPYLDNAPEIRDLILEVHGLLKQEILAKGDICDDPQYSKAFAYVYLSERTHIYLCRRYHESPFREKVYTLIHESFHLLGYKDPHAYTFEHLIVQLTGF